MHLTHGLFNNMKEYQITNIPHSDIKEFSITLGLLPGYKLENIESSIDDVLVIYKDWIQKRLTENNYIFPAKITPCYFVYGFKRDRDIINNSENAVEIQGEILKEHCPDFGNNEILLNTINELASLLENRLKQKRVHIQFMNQKYILE